MSYVQEELGYDTSPCTQDPSDPVCQAFHQSSPAPGGTQTQGPFSAPPTFGTAPVIGKPGSSLPMLAIVGGAALLAVVLLRPKSNPRRRRYRRRR